MEAVRDLRAGLSVPGRTKRYDKVLERLGRIKERHSKVARHYAIAVRPGKKKKGKHRLAAAVTLRRSEQDAERIVQTYWQLADIEATFHSLKSEAGLRPVYHRKPEHVRGHLFIAVLAYHAIHLLRRRLQARGIHASWATIRHQLSRWMRQTTRLQAEDGSWIETRQDHATGRGGGGDRGGAGPAGTAAPAAGAHTRAGGGPGIGAPVRGPAIRWGEKSCGDITAAARL